MCDDCYVLPALQFPYLTACFNEALRLDPPLGLGTVRMNREDTTICGYRIPKGAWLNVRFRFFHTQRARCKNLWRSLPWLFHEANTAAAVQRRTKNLKLLSYFG